MLLKVSDRSSNDEFFGTVRSIESCSSPANGSPSFFLMCTTNPTWPEIQREMKPNEKAHDRPDLVARIFKIKLKQLLADMWAGKCFGTAVYVVGVI